MQRIFFILILLFFGNLQAQNLIDVQPIAGTVDFAGTFGELRNHHFHSGVDIRTNGQTGWPVRAVQDGYLSRMVVRQDGFGWALYIQHPSGYTSVYAHLEDFQPQWHSVATANASRLESNRLDLYFQEEQYPVSAGDTIAWSGNSGGSGGPHLHFEWRDSRSEEPLDPFSFGLQYGEDSYPPNILSVYTSDGSYRNVSNGTWVEGLKVTNWADIGAYVVDRKHPSGLTLGIKSLEAIWDPIPPAEGGSASTKWVLDRFSFAETRSADGLMQPEVKRKTGKRTYRIIPSLAPAPEWRQFRSIPQSPGKYQVTIQATSTNGDRVSASGPIDFVPNTASEGVRNASLAGYASAGAMQVVWSANSFTDPIQVYFNEIDSRHWNAGPDVPVLKNLAYTWTPPAEYPTSWKTKTVLIGRDGRGSYRIVGTPNPEGRLHFDIKILGELTITQDLNPPTLQNLQSGSFQNAPAWTLNMKDNLLDIVDYDVYLNGQWLWAYYDAKNGRLYIPKPMQQPGTLKIVAKDEAGNISTFEQNIP
jgi:murein DD-endopeptidase MepM/ murein hydrolase activator NlpD